MSDHNFELGENFNISLTMLSDWHVGTGSGVPKGIDALASKDHEGFPQVPAKTIIGIWRDALETLTLGLDSGTEANWSKWVDVIFGNQPALPGANPTTKPFSSILSLQPARINKKLRDKIQTFPESERTKYKQALTFIKPEIKIDEASGTTATDMLRLAEMGRSGTVLEANCELHLNKFDADEATAKSQRQIISALLIASAKLLERIGGKRRRGSGKCELKIKEKELSQQLVDFLKSADASKIPPVKDENDEREFGTPESGTEWLKHEYTLTLQTPVSIVTATLGNVSETLDFIPGTYLLPHISKGKRLFKHLANGDLQVSPATIEVKVIKRNKNGEVEKDKKGNPEFCRKRGLPVPKVIYFDKIGGGFDKEKKVFNRFNDEENKLIKEGEQKKNYREGYLSSLENEGKILPFHHNTEKILLMHNTVEDDVQRPTSDVGGVYSRQAIAAGTVLHGEIRYKKSLDLIFPKSPEEVRLGTSKKDDYGLAIFKIEDSQSVKSSATGDKELIVYLESDVLLRNGNLRQTNLVNDLKEFLKKKLHVELTEKDSLIQTRRIESWNVGWGFPRPTLIAMQAGSCVRFKVAGNIADANLQKLEIEGIGERRGEGYGRIRFNPPILTAAINGWEKAVKSFDKTADTTSETLTADGFAQQIEKTVWREELRRAALLIADDSAKREVIFGFVKNGKPSFSQIGSLRSVIMRLKDDGSNKRIVPEWLEHLKATSNRLDKWKTFGEIVNLFANDKQNLVWEKLGWQEPPVMLNGSKIKEELWAEAVRTLFDACARAHKRDAGEN